MAEQSTGQQNTGAGLYAAGSIVSLYGQNKSSKARQGESMRQASLLNLTGDEIMRRYEINKKSVEGDKRKAVGSAIAAMGASGGGSESNQVIIDIMTEADQSMEVMRQEAEYNAWVQREEARAYERQAEAEAKARKKHTTGTILGAVGTVAGTILGGGPAGGAAGGSVGYAAGSAMG